MTGHVVTENKYPAFTKIEPQKKFSTRNITYVVGEHMNQDEYLRFERSIYPYTNGGGCCDCWVGKENIKTIPDLIEGEFGSICPACKVFYPLPKKRKDYGIY